MKTKPNALQTEQQHSLFSPAFLMSYWAKEYDAYCASLIQQLNTLDTALATLQTQIQTQETQLNQHTYQLYNLTQDEIALIEN